jgi:hypothetical protein
MCWDLQYQEGWCCWGFFLYIYIYIQCKLYLLKPFTRYHFLQRLLTCLKNIFASLFLFFFCACCKYSFNDVSIIWDNIFIQLQCTFCTIFLFLWCSNTGNIYCLIMCNKWASCKVHLKHSYLLNNGHVHMLTWKLVCKKWTHMYI